MQAGYCWRPSFPQSLQATLQGPPFMHCPAEAGLLSCPPARAGHLKRLSVAALPMAVHFLASRCVSTSLQGICSAEVYHQQIEL